jgi:hypothetical protein
MALGTGGTNATSSLSSIIFSRQMSTANIALIQNGIKGQNAVQTIKPGAFSQIGQLHLPGGRGIITCLPGDYIMLDATSGWPILVSDYAIANGPWTHS